MEFSPFVPPAAFTPSTPSARSRLAPFPVTFCRNDDFSSAKKQRPVVHGARSESALASRQGKRIRTTLILLIDVYRQFLYMSVQRFVRTCRGSNLGETGWCRRSVRQV